MSQELIDRWAAFLGKVTERLDAIIAEAGPGVLGIARAHTEDSLPIGNAITGLDHRVRQLDERIDKVWEDKVEAQFSGVGGAVHDRGIDMKADAKMDHDHRWTTAKASWMTSVAAEALPRAEAAMAEQVVCTRCGGPLQLASRRKTVSHPCESCGTVNQVTMHPHVRYYYGFCVQNLAEAAALPHRQALEKFREQVDRKSRANNWAPESLESMAKWRDMERACWQAHADRRAELLGEPVDTDYVTSRMKQFIQFNHDMNQAWVKTHGKGAIS